MRLTAPLFLLTPLLTPLLTTTLLAACVAPVGGDDSDRDPKVGDCDLDDDSIKVVSKNYTFKSIDDIEDAELPSGCWDLDGTLRIESPNVTSLAKLGKLAAVTNLELINTKLTKLDFVEPVTVYETLDIRSNTSLGSLDGLTIDQDRAIKITVQDNGALTSLAGLSDLTKLEHKVDLAGTILTRGDLVIRGNAKLTTLGLTRLNEVMGRFEIDGNGALAKIDGLSDLATVGDLRISNNAALTTIDIANLETVKAFEIADNAALTSFSGIRAHQIGGNLMIRNNRALTSFGSMFSLDSISGNVAIDNNAALTNLGMFTLTLRTVAGTMTVSNNPQLTDLGSVSHLGAIAGAVSITNNVKLPYCKALEIDHCVSSGAVSIVGNLNTTMTNCNCWCE